MHFAAVEWRRDDACDSDAPAFKVRGARSVSHSPPMKVSLAAKGKTMGALAAYWRTAWWILHILSNGLNFLLLAGLASTKAEEAAPAPG
jgi:hypothetical protein